MQEVGRREPTSIIGSPALFAGSAVTAFGPIKLVRPVTANTEPFPAGVLSQPPTILLSAALLLGCGRPTATSRR